MLHRTRRQPSGRPPSPAVVSPGGYGAGVAYDLDLANRIREIIGAESGLSERPMFGGLAFLINGHLAVAASRQGGLLLRIDPARTQALLARAHAKPFAIRGRDLDGWLRVEPAGVTTKRDLARWVAHGYVREQPASETRLSGVRPR